MSFWISPDRRKRKAYSLDRFRVVYADLLQHIDVNHEELGSRRGINTEDADLLQKFQRFSFRRTVIPQPSPTTPKRKRDLKTPRNYSSDPILERSSPQSPEPQNFHYSPPATGSTDATTPSTTQRELPHDLAAAFRILAATRSPDKEGDDLGGAVIRDDAYAAALAMAQRIEARVVELIGTLGDILANAEQEETATHSYPQRTTPMPPRCDAVFEYFCERNMLSLLVEMCQEKRHGTTSKMSQASFHGVVWSPNVKAQVLETMGMLIADKRNQSILYYLLSNNYVNNMVQAVLPVKQWTDPALTKMLPPYADLLRACTVRLAEDPSLFPFFVVHDNTNDAVTFPIFTAALETASSLHAKSDSQVYGTCLAVVVNVMQIQYEPIQTWVCNAGSEQRRLSDHLCQRLLERYYRVANLTTGPVVDGARSSAIAGQLSALKDDLGMIHQIFQSGVKGLDVRLCETLLQRVVSVLLKNLLPRSTTHFLVVGVIDLDVIPESEALTQVATIFLSYLFSTLSYVPFQRMLGVATFHPRSTKLWQSISKATTKETGEDYIFMPALSDIVNGEDNADYIPNAYSEEVMKGIRGDYGEWRAVACASLLQTALSSGALENESSHLCDGISGRTGKGQCKLSFESAIVSFLRTDHKPSPMAAKALDHVGYLAVQLLHTLLLQGPEVSENDGMSQVVDPYSSPMLGAMIHAKVRFATQAMECQKITGVSEIFLDLVESTISSRYSSRQDKNGNSSFICKPTGRSCRGSPSDSEIVVRRYRGATSNDVESSRFFINMSLQFRSFYRTVHRLACDARENPEAFKKRKSLIILDEADALTVIVGGLSDSLSTGYDLDLTGRMTFKFRSPSGGEADSSVPEQVRTFHTSSYLMLVLDTQDMFVVKPVSNRVAENRGSVICSISLRSVIAAAADGAWLHVAARHDDVGSLIKNGNIAMQFETAGTCLTVKQYFDRARELLRHELLEKVSALLKDCSTTQETDGKESADEEKKEGEVPNARSL